ncbi:MAG: hypothetical protein ACRDJH_27260 [Thermomicrobiales bacterium]
MNNPDAGIDDVYDLTARTLNASVVVTLGVRPAQGQYAASNTITRAVAESEALVGAGSGSGW